MTEPTEADWTHWNENNDHTDGPRDDDFDADPDTQLAQHRTDLAAGVEAAAGGLAAARYVLHQLRHTDPHLPEQTAGDIEAYLDGTDRVLRSLAAVAQNTILTARVRELEAALHDANTTIRDVYRQRAHLTANLAAQHPAVLDEDATDDTGKPLLAVDLPTGQATWHIEREDLDLLGHVARGTAVWDGHDTAEKYRRLDAHTRLIAGLRSTAGNHTGDTR